MAESIEAKLAMGQQIDLAEHVAISSTLVRLASRLGLSRVAREVPDLQDYLAARYGRSDDAVDDAADAIEAPP